MLIADSGSTKTDWVLMDGASKIAAFKTEGMNPYTHTEEAILASLRDAFSQIPMENYPQRLFFYGAGCSNEAMVDVIRRQIGLVGYKGEIDVSHDLMAAARALFGKESGIACILGTGSSSCHFKKGEVAEKVPSLGYVLGDEGGGADLGKRLLISVLKKDAPESLMTNFYSTYGLTPDQILQKIYFEGKPNKFLASFAPFVRENLDHAYMLNLARLSFSNFIDLNIMKYAACRELPVGFVGSVAINFKELIEALLEEKGLIPGPFLKEPMQGLMSYHA